MEEEKKNYVKDKEVEFIGVDVQKVRGKEDIERIRFKTNDPDIGDITYKPETDTEEFQEGIKVTGVRQLGINEIPKKVKEIAKKISENKSCKVKVSYQLFDTTTREGEPVTYNYIRWQSQLDKWEIL